MRQRGPRAPLVATFFAFRARRGVLLFPSALLYALGCAAIAAAFVLVHHDALRAFAHGGPPPSLERIWPSAALALLLQRLLAAAWEAGCLRWMILGERGGVFGLSFGAATFRVLAVHLAWGVLLALGTAFVWAVAFGLDAAVAPVAALADSAAWFFRDIAFPALKALAALIVLAVAVKLSPAAALTVALDKFAFLSAWRITRGRFLALTGAFAASALLTIGALALLLGTCAYFFLTRPLNEFVAVAAAPAALASIAIPIWLSLMRFGMAARAVQAAVEDAS